MDFGDWKNRVETGLGDIRQTLEQKQQILDRLQQVHQQVRAVIDSGSTESGGIPWELARGLSILDKVLDGKPLPTTEDELPTRVMDDGTLLGCRKWELLDPLWGEALVQWIGHLWDYAPWAGQPGRIQIADKVSFCIAGDWGTGDYIAAKVAAAMRRQPADYTIHLGDVYYAGVGSDESNDLAGWPPGVSGQFTLNSNHEMYNGALGYFGELSSKFPMQQGTSYFSLHNGNWLIVGLDSAYHSDKMGLYMDGALGDLQTAWLKQLAAGWGGKIMLLSHHQGYTMDGSATTPLYRDVAAALGRAPDYWYWGHLHNVICYRPQGRLVARCVGHGAIPYGPAKLLDGKPGVEWAETRSADDSRYPERVLNGFVRLELDGAALSETFYDENGYQRWPER
ncbi:metallophosphoesterase [Chromobacterium sp. ATCC 53434]|uniref:metallophosphoesterase family protein n=1 Tax=Chromobacterium sp. (strain ATCC 53434 / SC 14030) TaxID=2059672 RepID=UPI000C75A39D|nr:metallophosphoesterase [Chromobacterium sp. ATCC 53434]AUH51315.1 metallophosphoesterase [Chromobacterium sp. ATCC 53434]